MIKTALIFVPHQDDELNIAGTIIDQMVAANVQITVCFLTNGDWRNEQEKRLIETERVANILGYKNIIYLGYGDGGFDNSLYYALDDTEIIKSPAGKTETYGIGNKEDYHYQKYKQHAKYTKSNVKNDIKDVIKEINADIIFCIDKDEHPDHKLLSEQFDNAIIEIIETTCYRPIVLKAFAYLGVFYGKPDYFIRPMQQTICKSYGKWARNDCKPYNWDERICLAVNESIFPLLWWKSKLFKALRTYKTQNGIKFYPRICNADAVYWFYDTSSGKYTVSRDFPIEKTPFRFYEKSNEKRKVHSVLKMLYDLYLLITCRIPRKIRRILQKCFQSKN